MATEGANALEIQSRLHQNSRLEPGHVAHAMVAALKFELNANQRRSKTKGRFSYIERTMQVWVQRHSLSRLVPFLMHAAASVKTGELSNRATCTATHARCDQATLHGSTASWTNDRQSDRPSSDRRLPLPAQAERADPAPRTCSIGLLAEGTHRKSLRVLLKSWPLHAQRLDAQPRYCALRIFPMKRSPSCDQRRQPACTSTCTQARRHWRSLLVRSRARQSRPRLRCNSRRLPRSRSSSRSGRQSSWQRQSGGSRSTPESPCMRSGSTRRSRRHGGA